MPWRLLQFLDCLLTDTLVTHQKYSHLSRFVIFLICFNSNCHVFRKRGNMFFNSISTFLKNTRTIVHFMFFKVSCFLYLLCLTITSVGIRPETREEVASDLG